MSTRSLTVVVMVLITVTGYTCSGAQETPNLGRPATPAEIAGWDISILPDGTELPPGSGTPEQGTVVYTQRCQACHDEKNAGKPNDQLVDEQSTLASANPVRTIGSYWPY